jgi:amino acid transporter
MALRVPFGYSNNNIPKGIYIAALVVGILYIIYSAGWL